MPALIFIVQAGRPRSRVWNFYGALRGEQYPMKNPGEFATLLSCYE